MISLHRWSAKVAIVAAFFIAATPSFAQWQTPNHSVPIGRGSGTGFKSAVPSTSGVPLISQGAASDPAFGTATVPGGGTGATTFTSGNPIVGNGVSPLSQGSRSGNTTTFATTSGSLPSGNCVQFDADGNLVNSGGVCGELNCVAAPSVCIALFGYVDVTWYGAVGDYNGSTGTDNTAAFNAAIAALGPNGGTIYVPGGTNNQYFFATQAGPANPSVCLNDNNHVRISPDAWLYTQGGRQAGVYGFSDALFRNCNQSTGNFNQSIEGGNFKCVATSALCGSFVSILNVKGFRLSNVRLMDIWGAVRAQFAYSADVQISNIYMNYDAIHASPYSFEDGLRIESGSQNIQITNADITSGDDAFAINNETSSNQTPITSVTGVPWSVNGAGIYGVTATNLILATSAGNAIRMYQQLNIGGGTSVGTTEDVTLSNVRANPSSPTGAQYGITLEDFSLRSAFNNIKLTDVQINCVNIIGAAAGCVNLYYAPNVKITNAVVSNYPSYGISANNSPNLQIVNPTVVDAQVGGADAILISNSSTSSQVSGGFLSAPQRYGVNIDGSNNVLVSGVNINSAPTAGINIGGSALYSRVIGNSIPNGGAAINEASGSDYTTASNNNVWGASSVTGTFGSHSQYTGNSGYNYPITLTGVTVGASPFTFANPDPRPITAYISGGTIAGVNIAGSTVYTSCPCTMPMGPGQSIDVFYSATPTIKYSVQ